MFNGVPTNSGLVRTIILVIIALLVLSYFGFNLRNLADSSTTQDNFGFVKTFILKVWNDYLKRPILYLWSEIFIRLIWNPAIENLHNIKEGEADSIRSGAPKISTSTSL